ncbi:YdhR family protein [Solitalea koreensis]|uniref:Mono-oxygenase ydhR n=1 Tax=Solitalea koreensis TaxID=543615 RepID=A0A521EF74_9SPHI|nr:YdhR family protein [Solitalea koreensis]SMO82559.1 Putative mono-oxygenase ydhR [Solitalea koreensis]
MAQKILVTNYTYSVSREEFENMANQLAHAFADVPGCLWKIWLIDAEKKEAGAVYLFSDEESLKKFKSSPLVASVLSHPALSDFDLKEMDILLEVSKITYAPLMGKTTV